MRLLFKYLLVALNALVALGILLGVLCTRLSPESYLLLPYFGLFFPFLCLANVGFVVLWAVKRKVWFFFALAVFVGALPWLMDIFPLSQTRSAAEGQREISVLSYNVRFFNDGKSFNDIYALIEQEHPDVVCLQEFGFWQKGTLKREEVYRKFRSLYPYRHVWYKNQFPWLEYGVVTFSKYPIVKKQKIDYESRNNISIYSDIVVEGDTIRVFNNHLESVKFSDKDKVQVGNIGSEPIRGALSLTERLTRKFGRASVIRAQQADVVAQEVRKSPYKTVVCGDFNDLPISYSYQTIRGGQQDVYSSTSFGFDYTYHDMAIYLRIDHIFVSQEFTPLSCTIEHLPYSDHDPLFARIALP